MQGRECWGPCAAQSTTGIWGAAAAGAAQGCTAVLPLAQGAAKTCSQGLKSGFLPLYFLLCFFFPFHSALPLQLAHRAGVLQVSDELLLIAIFISQPWHSELCFAFLLTYNSGLWTYRGWHSLYDSFLWYPALLLRHQGAEGGKQSLLGSSPESQPCSNWVLCRDFSCLCVFFRLP